MKVNRNLKLLFSIMLLLVFCSPLYAFSGKTHKAVTEKAILGSGTNDLATFAYFWLNGPHPLDVFESFKAALLVGDVNEALTYIAEISREKYAEIFQIIEPNLPDYVSGMGELTFDRQRNDEVIYEMRHQDGAETLSFPVFFIRDEDGNWRLFNF